MLKENNVRTGFFEPHQYQAVIGHLPTEISTGHPVYVCASTASARATALPGW